MAHEVKKNFKGITLIALVVTIIVLLILAGVAISLTVGNNGLFRKAKEAADTYKEAESEEKGALGTAEKEIDNVINRDGNGTGDSEETEKHYFYYYKVQTADYIWDDLTESLIYKPLTYSRETLEFELGMTWRDFLQSEFCPEYLRIGQGGGVEFAGNIQFPDGTDSFRSRCVLIRHNV